METTAPIALEEQQQRPPKPSARASVWRRLRRRPAFTAGLVIIGLLIIVALFGPSFTSYTPTKTNPSHSLEEPSLEFPFGTDKFGRDMLTRVVYATRLDLIIAASVALSAFAVGSFVGGIAGYYGGWIEDIVMRLADVLFAFPSFILAMAITGILGDSIPNVIIAIAISYTPFFIRLTHGEMLTVRTHQYAAAARSVGNPGWRIILIHLLPNALTPSLMQVPLVFGWAILNAAGLAFLGLGITPPTAEWGVLVSEGAQLIVSGEWWVWLFPGLAIVIASLGFNLVGDSLRDISANEDH